MSSRVNVKTSKKDRPRSSDKIKKGNKRDGTPEKPTTPNASQDALLEEDAEAKKQIIINDEILAMQIKPEDLQKLRDPRPPSSEKRRTPANYPVVVRKLKPASEWNKPKPKLVTVAKPAPANAPLKPLDYNGAAGPRYDKEGNIIPHSLLGSIEDYKTQAIKQGGMPVEFLTTKEKTMEADVLTVKYEKKANVSQYPKFQNVEESNALKNWQQKMLERKKQQGYLSKLLNKPPEQLVMNQSDSYRQTQELRYLLDRTIPTMDYGKGYRIGSEFWNQQERVGDELTGIHMTMTQIEKGYPAPIEHVGVPPVALGEKGTNWDKPRTPFHKPWHKTPYLRERINQLRPVMDELDPHQPDMRVLEIVGSNKPPGKELEVLSETGMSEKEEQREEFAEMEVENIDPLRDHPDVHPEPIFGPSIQFAGQPARWTGDSSSFVGQVGIEARVTFEAYSGFRTTSFLEIVNDGTTSIYFDWKKIPKTNPFDMVNAKVQRFYFNTSSGVILPGDTMKFPFVFKSPNAGVFTEQWQFQTRPVVCGGAALVVTLRGVALQQDKFEEERTQLECDLARKQAEQIVEKVLDNILEGIRSPDRPSSPVDAYITEEEVFHRKNPGLHFHNGYVSELKTQYLGLFPEEEREDKEWDLSVDNLKQMIMSMDEDDDQKQELLQQLNVQVFNLGFPPFTPKQQEMFNVGYEMLTEAIDGVAGESMRLREALGMPEMEGGEIPDDPINPLRLPSPSGESTTSGISNDGDGRRSSKDYGRNKTSRSNTSDSAPASSQSERGEGKKGGGKGKPDPKDKKGGKDTKPAPKGAKEPPAKAGKVAPASKRPVTREDKTRVQSPGAGSGTQSPILSTGDPIMEAKFREKLYTQSYVIVSEMLNKMDEVFGEIQESEGGQKLPILS